MLEEQERELHAMEVENGCCDCEIENESEPYCHIFTDEEVRTISGTLSPEVSGVPVDEEVPDSEK